MKFTALLVGGGVLNLHIHPIKQGMANSAKVLLEIGMGDGGLLFKLMVQKIKEDIGHLPLYGFLGQHSICDGGMSAPW